MGEREPLSDYASTHGICEHCVASNAAWDEGVTERTRPIRELHVRLTDIATAGRVDDVGDILREGAGLGLGAIEMLIGVLQPALYQVGCLWERGRISPAEEARLTTFCEQALEALAAEQRARVVSQRGAPVLLLAADGNAHSLGLEMLAFALREAGRDVRTYRHAPAMREVIALCEALDPAAVGVSVALVDQLPYVTTLVDTLMRREHPPRIVVGGRAAPTLPDLPASVVRWSSSDSLLTAPALFA